MFDNVVGYVNIIILAAIILIVAFKIIAKMRENKKVIGAADNILKFIKVNVIDVMKEWPPLASVASEKGYTALMDEIVFNIQAYIRNSSMLHPIEKTLLKIIDMQALSAEILDELIKAGIISKDTIKNK